VTNGTWHYTGEEKRRGGEKGEEKEKLVIILPSPSSLIPV
jgi:hypothetical protein